MSEPPAERPAAQDTRGAPSRRTEQQAPNPNYVSILNPIPCDKAVIKKKLAERWVKHGRAEWREKKAAIYLVTTHPANIEAVTAAAIALARSTAGYDGVNWEPRVLTPQELLNIGIVMPDKAIRENLTVRTTPTSRHFVGRSGPVRSIPPPQLRIP